MHYAFYFYYTFVGADADSCPCTFFSQTQVISDETWKLIDGIWDKRVEEIKAEASIEVEEEKETPQLLMGSHFV